MLVLLRSGFMLCGRSSCTVVDVVRSHDFPIGFHHLTLGGCAPRDHRADSARPPRSRILGRPPSPPTGVVPYVGRPPGGGCLADLRAASCRKDDIGKRGPRAHNSASGSAIGGVLCRRVRREKLRPGRAGATAATTHRDRRRQRRSRDVRFVRLGSRPAYGRRPSNHHEAHRDHSTEARRYESSIAGNLSISVSSKASLSLHTFTQAPNHGAVFVAGPHPLAPGQ
jgi:hypothetical protein